MLVALGIIIGVLGAILTFAVEAEVGGLELSTIGWILMAGGAIALVAGAIKGAGWLSMSNHKVQHERHESADGRHVVEESKVS